MDQMCVLDIKTFYQPNESGAGIVWRLRTLLGRDAAPDVHRVG